MGKFRDKIRYWLGVGENPVAPAERAEMKINPLTVAEAGYGGREAVSPWKVPTVPAWAPKAEDMAMALDRASGDGMGLASLYQYAGAGMFSEGIGFLGYTYLAELTQRPEYRRASEIYARHATRKGIKFNSDDDRVKAIETAMGRFRVWPVLRRVVELDGFFGRGQIFIDVGDDGSTAAGARELQKPFVPDAKIKPDGLVGFRTIEPFWSYPGPYESVSPLHPDFYKPKTWYVMSNIVDASRLMTIVGREMPDMLKPAYSFGGLSLSQMIKPYVDNWLRTRQSVSDLLHSFSTMVLATNMGAVLSGGKGTNLFSRLDVFNRSRDNRGVMAIDKEQEELTNVSTPLGTLDKLLAQSQEQICSASGIPIAEYCGSTPAGLNASTDGENRTFYTTIKAYQEAHLREPLQAMIDYIQLDLDGKIDPDLQFEFIDLWEMDEKDKALIRKSDADMDVAYVGAGIVSNEEVRDRVVQDEDSPYFGVDLSAPAPEPEPEPGLEDGEGGDDDNPNGSGEPKPKPDTPAGKDAAPKFEEGKHPRAANGQFGSGGGRQADPVARRRTRRP